MTRKLLIAGGILAVIFVVAVKYLASNLDSIVKKAITTLGAEMTGVSVKVDDVAIALADGRGEIGGLVVGNPRGYQGPHAFKLGSILLALDAAADTKDVVVIRELTVEAPDIVYDKGPDGSNVEAIQNNIDEYSRTHPAGEDRAQDAAKKDDRASARRFIVESLQIRNGKIRLPDRDVVIDLPPLSMRDVGKSRGGMTGSEIASIVVKQMTQATVSAAARGAAQDAVREAVDEKNGRPSPSRPVASRPFRTARAVQQFSQHTAGAAASGEVLRMRYWPACAREDESPYRSSSRTRCTGRSAASSRQPERSAACPGPGGRPRGVAESPCPSTRSIPLPARRD